MTNKKDVFIPEDELEEVDYTAEEAFLLEEEEK
jgi:hypothetical protein